jgi:N-acetylglucosamine-6-phosphate deacetylase
MVGVTVVKGRIVTPSTLLDGGRVIIDGDIIVAVLAATDPAHAREADAAHVVDVGPQYVLPGFVDIHNHGLGGCDEVMDHWQHPKYSLSRLLQCGTLSVMASVIFSVKRNKAVDATLQKIESVVGRPMTVSNNEAEAKAKVVYAAGSVIEGIHAEGPIIEDCGGLPESATGMSLGGFRELCQSMPSLKIMTIAPSAEERVGYERLKHLTQLGVRASLGHDKKATEKAIVGALKVLSVAKNSKAGGTDDHVPHLTHVYNVMAFHHREPGLVNYALCAKLPRTPKYEECTVAAPTAEIIGDMIHVHPVAVASLLSARDPKNDIALISDCIAGYEPGRRMRYNGRLIAVKAEGGCYLTDPLGNPTTTLAGSTVTLADQLHTLLTCFHVDLVTAARMLATTPAKIAHIDHKVGSIKAGLKANLLVVSEGLEEIRRRMVYGLWSDDESIGPYRMLRPILQSSL